MYDLSDTVFRKFIDIPFAKIERTSSRRPLITYVKVSALSKQFTF